MCGFVGFSHQKASDTHQTITHMMDAIVHRGPDSSGVHIDNHIALGFRRLSIIDISEGASQPMYNEDKSIVLVFNGEIYNYEELRHELMDKGHVFQNQSDSEVLIHGYEEYGHTLLQRLRGMFAFAIWDINKQRLFMARDFMGIKPLYYTQHSQDGSLIFGSEIKAFLEHPQFMKTFNEEALKPYLTFQYSAMSETFFKGVYKLPPGHFMIYEAGVIHMERYWDAEFETKEASEAHYIKAIQEQMKASVAYHKISDVKVGSFLSGGIDSSYIATLLKPDKTFSVGFSDHEEMFNETNLAKEFSDLLGIENHKQLVHADDFFAYLPQIQYHMDEPQSNLSAVPLYFLSKMAREHVTVVLSGEGADELFGGYAWYERSYGSLAYEKLPFFMRKGLASLLSKAPENRLTDFIRRGGQRVEDKFIGQAYIFKEDEAERILKGPYAAGASVKAITDVVYSRVQGKDELSKMQYLDISLWLPGDILLKADKMSMAHSIELRVPFLDKEVMALAGSLPPKMRVKGKQAKYALRKAAAEVMPFDWANRKKVGFAVPFKHWLREEKYYHMVKTVFTQDYVKTFFQQDTILEYLEEHYRGEKNNARRVYTIYTFLVWYRVFFIDR